MAKRTETETGISDLLNQNSITAEVGRRLGARWNAKSPEEQAEILRTSRQTQEAIARLDADGPGWPLS